MKRNPFKQKLLAVVVGAISGQALAVEVDIGQGKTNWISEMFNESLTLTGTLTQPTNLTANQGISNWRGVSVANTNIQGSLVSRADIVLDAEIGSFKRFPWIQRSFKPSTLAPAPSRVT